MTRPIWILLLLLVGCGGGGGGGDDGPYEPPLGDDVRLDGGDALSVFPQIAQVGERIHTVWYDRRDGKTDVYFRRSLDGGRTWPLAERRLDTDPAGAASSNVPRIAADGDRVYVVWEDTRGGLSEVRFNRSLDAGLTWLTEDVRLDRGASDGSSFEIQVACVGEAVWVVWEDDRDGGPDIRLNRSIDAGTTWLAADVRLDTDVLGTAASLRPQIVAEANRVLVVWEDARDGGLAIRTNQSEDGGVTWLGGDLRVDTRSGVGLSVSPAVALDGARAIVVFSDDRTGSTSLWANASEDGGLTWLADDVRVDDGPAVGGGVNTPRVVLHGQDAIVVWEDDRNGLADVYARTSGDGGGSWVGTDVRLDTGPPGTASSISPTLGRTASHVFVAFADDREGRFDLLLQTSSDGGLTWRDAETRLDQGPAGAANALAPDLVGLGAEARVVWYDDRSGREDIYFNRGPSSG